MFDLDIMVVAADAATRTKRKRAKTTAKSAARKGRGGRRGPHSAARRKAISAGLKRYWGSKRASHRRRGAKSAKRSTKSSKGAKRGGARRGGKSGSTPAPSGTVNKPSTRKAKHPKTGASTGAQVAMAATKPRRTSLAASRRRNDSYRHLSNM